MDLVYHNIFDAGLGGLSRVQIQEIHFSSSLSESRPQFAVTSTFPWYRFGVDYDCLSVLHYHPKAASKTGARTMVAIWKGCSSMGQRNGATANDYRKLCVLYNSTECIGRPFNRTTNFCPWPLVPKEVDGCEQTLEASSGGDFLVNCCQSREELANSLTAPDGCDSCVPHEACEGSDLFYNPDFFRLKCCGW